MSKPKQPVMEPLKQKKEKIFIDNGFNAQILHEGKARTLHPKHIFNDVFFAVIDDTLYAFRSTQAPIFAYKLLKRFKLDVFVLDTNKAIPEYQVKLFATMIGNPPGYDDIKTIEEFLEFGLKDNEPYKDFKKEVNKVIIKAIPPQYIHSSETKQINHLSASSEFLYETLQVLDSSRYYANLVQFRQAPKPTNLIILVVILVIAGGGIGAGALFLEGGSPQIPGFGQFGKSPDQLFMEQYSPEEAKAALDRGEIQLSDIPAAMRPGIQAMDSGTVDISDPEAPATFENLFDLPDFMPGSDTPEAPPPPPPPPEDLLIIDVVEAPPKEVPPPTITPSEVRR